MWKKYNPNPFNRSVGDCAVRAVSKALGVDWDTAFALIVVKAFAMKDMQSSNSVWGSVLKDHGFVREVISSDCPDCYTAEDFIKDHPKGVYVLGFGTHVATAQDGLLFDSWDSSKEIPQYYWVKKEIENDGV